MKTWNQLFIRQGFYLKEVGENEFDCSMETVVNRTFLSQCLHQLGVAFIEEDNVLTMLSAPVTELEWLGVADFKDRGHFGNWFPPESEEPRIHELDAYVSGLVRQFKRLGLYTLGSCDGHGERQARIQFLRDVDMEKVESVLKGLSFKNYRIQNRSVVFRCERYELLDIVESMNQIEKDWVDHGEEFIKKQLFFNELEKLLSINGESGNEEKVRDYVLERLTPYVDRTEVDKAGNLLAYKKYGSGHGPCIVVNAHLDTCAAFEKDRKIIKENEIWSSSNGILGADDRAGVAAVLQLAKSLRQSRFHGRVKFIFTVKEEIGLVGARAVRDSFLWDVDAALVLDRRGSGDIIVSYGHEDFCHPHYGRFMEETAIEAGLSGWKCRAGGSSDTRIWASHGVQSVNLSVGYNDEHTSSETLDIEACYRTVQFVDKYFERCRGLVRIPR